MISIIISSYQQFLFSDLEKNIAETCGVPYEIIRIDNPNLMSITEAYNRGAERANYDYLLFIHEDVLFRTNNWGEKLIAHLADESVGVIGVAGSSYVPKAPCGWNVYDEKYNHFNFIQNNKQKNNEVFSSSFKKKIEKIEVFAIDGVFLATKKKVHYRFPFNEDVIGFHGYDLAFSLQIAKKYQNYVISDILIEHFSLGNTDVNWFNSNINVRKIIGFHPYQKHKNSLIESLVFNLFFANYMKYKGISIKTILESLYFYPFFTAHPKLYFKTIKLIFYHLKYKKEYTEKYLIS